MKNFDYLSVVEDTSPEPDAAEKCQRGQRRVKFYLTENVRVEIFTLAKNLYGHCADISAGGLSAFIPKEKGHKSVTGELVQVIVKTNEGESRPLNARLVMISEQKIQQKDFWRLGLEFIKNATDKIDRAREIGQEVWLDEFIRPLLSIKDSFKINSLIHAQVVAFGKEGLIFQALNQDHVFLPGIIYDIKVQLPVGSEFSSRARLISIETNPSNHRIEGVLKFENLSLAAKEGIAQTCILGSDEASPSGLREIGMFVGPIEPATMEMTYPASDEEYQEMLELRRKSYQGVGKFLEAKAADEVWDEYDDISRHIIFRVRNRIVGTIRVVFCHKDYNLSEHVKWGVKIPEKIKKAGFVEVSRASVNENYRATDIFAGLIRHTIRLAVENNVRYVVVSCNPHLVPTYIAIGGKVVVKNFEAFGRNDCSLIVFDIPRITKTSMGSFIAFHVTSYPLFNWLYKRKPSHYIGNLPNLIVHRLLTPLIRHLLRVIMYKKFKKMELHARE